VCGVATGGWNQGAVELSTRILCSGARQFWGGAEHREKKKWYFGPHIFIDTLK